MGTRVITQEEHNENFISDALKLFTNSSGKLKGLEEENTGISAAQLNELETKMTEHIKKEMMVLKEEILTETRSIMREELEVFKAQILSAMSSALIPKWNTDSFSG